MGKIIKDIQNGKDIGTVLKSMIDHQKLNELYCAKEKYKDGDLEEIIDDIEKNYQLNLEKLDYVYELIGSDINLQRKFIEMVDYIDDLELSDYNLISTVLTTATMLYKLDEHPELVSNNQLYLVATAMISIPVDDYNMYGDILINKNVLNNIFIKTSNQDEQRKICYGILDYCDEFTSNDMSKKEKVNAVNDCVNIINKYKVEEKVKINK